MAVEPSSFQKFYTKFNRSREHLACGNLQSSLMNLAEAIKIKLNGVFLQRNLEAMGQDLFHFVQYLAASKLFKETYGPVTFAAGQEPEWLDFFDQLVFLKKDLIQRLERADELFEAGQIEEAAAILEEVLDDYKDDPEMTLDIGDRFMDRSLWSQAEKAFRLAVALNPEAVHSLNRLAMAQRKAGKLDEALNVYRQALTVSPQDEGLYYNTARVIYEMGKPELAVKILTLGLAKNPHFEAGLKFYEFLNKKLAEVKK